MNDSNRRSFIWKTELSFLILSFVSSNWLDLSLTKTNRNVVPSIGIDCFLKHLDRLIRVLEIVDKNPHTCTHTYSKICQNVGKPLKRRDLYKNSSIFLPIILVCVQSIKNICLERSILARFGYFLFDSKFYQVTYENCNWWTKTPITKKYKTNETIRLSINEEIIFINAI